mgnify:CR=1 FL=1
MQRVHIHLKNGKSCAENIIGDVLIVRKEKNLPKTTENHFLLMAQIIFQISSHCVEVAIVASGRNSTKIQNFYLINKSIGGLLRGEKTANGKRLAEPSTLLKS